MLIDSDLKMNFKQRIVMKMFVLVDFSVRPFYKPDSLQTRQIYIFSPMKKISYSFFYSNMILKMQSFLNNYKSFICKFLPL